MSEESPQEKQHNEIEALQAIFGDDLKDLREPNVWKTWKPLDLLLTLYPQQGSSGNQEIHCMIGLHIMCPSEYPETEPKLEVLNSKGLSDSQIKSLLTELEKLSRNLKGEVMIFELAQHVQTFLHQYNKPGFKSFYEEMMSRQKQNEQMKLHDKQVKEDKERQEIKDEILKRKEILKKEMKEWRKETRLGKCTEINENTNITSLAMNNVNDRTTSFRKRQSTSECSDISFCEHRGTKTINFKNDKTITRGKCLGHSERGYVTYVGLDAANGDLLAMSEWIIDFNTNYKNQAKSVLNKRGESPKHSSTVRYDQVSCMKQIANVEQELNFLTKLHHSNLVHYVNMKYVNENDNIIIYLLQEFIIGGNISNMYLKSNIIMETDVLRHFSFGILEAIDHLHRNNVVHKDIKDTNIFIDRTGAIRLADYSIVKRLMELYQNNDNSVKYSKKNDIFQIGLLLISLIKGELVCDSDASIPIDISPDLNDFISRCIDKNERTRWSSEQLLNHQFIKSPIYKPLPKKINDDDQSGSDGKDDSQGGVDLDIFIPTGSNLQSRIKNEFEILKWLGKGAYGDVLKVKNKLDGGCYAIKRIELNPKSKQLNKKITREVKLLSRLNHENVVRYYNSWIESATMERKNEFNGSDASCKTPTSKFDENDCKTMQYSFANNDDIEKFAPPAQSHVEWSISYSSSKQKQDDDPESSSDSEDDDDDDDDDVWDNFLSEIKTSSNSDSIEFKGNDSTTDLDEYSFLTEKEKKTKVHNKSSDMSESDIDSVEIQYLYIQMEFCEKSTLRNAIDNGLYADTDRVWRLFREIVEGLSHIHQQGMIHRDLKPVNIFLDSNDHVKIGDFGLATNILSRNQPVVEKRINLQVVNVTHDTSDISLTGHVGTALYVAPELVSTGKAIYNQKVDIYSLGIILFEMSYVPLKTGMERVKVLGNLRSKDILFPDNFNEQEKSNQHFLIRWLLNHDGSSRPTCTEILQCEQLPSALEECELKEVLRHALAFRSSKAYRHLINACFQQELTPAEAITYDMNVFKATLHHKQNLSITPTIKELVMKVFKLHGGIELTTPLLLPLCHLYDPVESSVRLMTHSGDVVHIPHDLRVPFARYVVRNGITLLKRYSIERVYREKKIFGFHPREMYECAFDIVTPTPGNLFAEAELLSIVFKICKEIPSMKSKNFAIHLNHTSLLKAILMNCGIDEEKYTDIYNILSDARDGKLSTFQVRTHLISLCLSDQAIMTFFNLMETECNIEKLPLVLKPLMKKKGDVSALAKAGIKDLETIVHNAQILGVNCSILILPCMVYNIYQYSGMMCQFICELKKKRRKGAWDVIAAGGRYDDMLFHLRKNLKHIDLTNKSEVPYQSAAGISLSLERLVQGAIMGTDDDDEPGFNSTSCDVCVCSTSSSKATTKEKVKIVSSLWNSGIKANLIDTVNLDEIQDICRDLSTTHIIILSDSEQGTVRVRSWERDRFQERKISTTEIVDFMQRLLKTWNDDSENSSYVGNNSSTNIQTTKSDSKICSDSDRSNSSMPNVAVNFITLEKVAANTRRRYENQIISQMTNTLQKISPKNRVEILAVSLDGNVLRTLTSYLEVDVQQNVHDKAVKTIVEKHSRNKKYLIEVCDEFRDLTLEKNRPIIAIYSLIDFIFKIFM